MATFIQISLRQAVEAARLAQEAAKKASEDIEAARKAAKLNETERPTPKA